MAGKEKTMAKAAIDHDLIRELAKLLDETGLTEIEIEQDGLRVRVGRGGAVASAPVIVPIAQPGAAPAAMPADAGKHPGLVTSPMVGTAYLGPEPGAMPFVDIGSKVVAGDTLLIIEAMKTMNQIPAPNGGTVTQVLFEDGQPVDYGQPLIVVE